MTSKEVRKKRKEKKRNEKGRESRKQVPEKKVCITIKQIRSVPTSFR